jgi:hypothetical protein
LTGGRERAILSILIDKLKFSQVKKMLPIIIGVLVGGVGGYFFYRYVGCKSGACMITGNPYLSTIYGMLMGGLVGNILK